MDGTGWGTRCCRTGDMARGVGSEGDKAAPAIGKGGYEAPGCVGFVTEVLRGKIFSELVYSW